MRQFRHSFAFDPTYGYTLEELQKVAAPEAPEGFAEFWGQRYRATLELRARPAIGSGTSWSHGQRVHDLQYHSAGGFVIGGWLVVPEHGQVERALVVGHGYGGRTSPDPALHMEATALVYPCFRGLSRSSRPWISTDPQCHVLHGIESAKDYILGGCVEDLWMAVSAALELFPKTAGRIGYRGTSFGGGLGALAMPWDNRIARGHLRLPTFGHHKLRLSLESCGSLAGLRSYTEGHNRHHEVMDTLRYFDAATAAGLLQQPMHLAVATFDPMVPPPGQFAVSNAVPEPKSVCVMDAGHFEWPGRAAQEHLVDMQAAEFFAAL